MADLDLRLDEAIDELNTGEEPRRVDAEIDELVALADAVSALTADEWPDEAFSQRLAAALADELAPRRRRLPRVRFGFGLAAAAAVVMTTLLVVVALREAKPVDAATLARQAFAASTGRSLGPVRFTQEITNKPPHGAFQPAPPPPRIVEQVVFAASDRWRVRATITEPNGEGTTTLLTVRNGNTIVTRRTAPDEGTTETRRTASAGARLPSVSVSGAQVDPMALLRQPQGRCARRLSVVKDGPPVAGRATDVLRVGAAPCPSADMPELNGPASFVVDEQTHLVLEALIHSGSGELTERIRTTAIATGGVIRPGLFRLPAPLPTPSPAKSAGMAFPAQIPTDLPARLDAGRITPVSTQASTGKTLAFTITYHGSDGRARLQLYEAAASTAGVRFPGHRVRLGPGLTGTFASRNGLQILWWIDDGVYVSLQQGGSASGTSLAGDYALSTLLRMAGSTR